MIYSVDDIIKARAFARAHGLSAHDAFLYAPEEDLRKICNGIGAESWEKAKRAALTAAFKKYEVPAMLHDVDYELQVGKKYADRRFLKNMKKLCRQEFGWWRYWFSPIAKAEKVVIYALYAAVALGGGDAYEEAGKKQRGEA